MSPVDASVLEGVTRTPLADSDGKSGATLERAVLADGTRVVVKRFDPEEDLVMRITGDSRGREVELWQSGVFDEIPVGHPVLGGWFEDGYGVLLMRDLGDSPLRWKDTLTAEGCARLLRGLVALHRHFQGRPPAGLCTLDAVVGMFGPPRIAPYAGNPIVDFALRGWEHWPQAAPGPIGDAVLALVHDATPLQRALAELTPTMIHGDLALVNCAFEGESLTLFDWGMATAGPGALDVGRFLAGCAQVVEIGPEGFLTAYRQSAGELYDERATRLGLLAGLVWLGWNKALDIVEHPDPAVRERERAALPWWLDRAAEGLKEL